MEENLKSPFITFNGMRYFYYPYKGEIACIPEWYLCRYYPRNMVELETIAEIWLERNKRGDYGKI